MVDRRSTDGVTHGAGGLWEGEGVDLMERRRRLLGMNVAADEEPAPVSVPCGLTSSQLQRTLYLFKIF